MKKSLRHNNKKLDPNSSLWTLTYNIFKPKEEGLREALCTLGNGYLGTRGAALESKASPVHYPGTYLAGVYNKLGTHIAKRTIYNEDFVNCPNWLYISFKVGSGEWISPATCKVLSFYQELNMQKGILFRRIRLKDKKGHINLIESTVIVSIADPHCGAIRYIITPENYTGFITARTALDGSIINSGVARYRQLNTNHLKLSSMRSIGKNSISLSVKTTQSDVHIAEAERVRIFSHDRLIKPVHRIVRKEQKRICQDFTMHVNKNHSYEIEKICFIYTSQDKGISNYLSAATVSALNAPDFTTLNRIQRQTWNFLWKKFDIRIEGDDFMQQVIRLHIFHLLQTASVHNVNIDAGLPARGLHGEAYRGHIFWDEMFVMPLFDFHSRKISRALLMYRYRRLSKAKRSAKRNSYRGAMFPWQSSSTGEEETQIVHLNPMSGKWGPDYSRIQRHVNFAIAYNIWKYWERSGDLDFMIRYGAEMFLLIAQFSASLVVLNTHDKRYHSDGIMGPDEFHEHSPGSKKPGLKDNAYSNIMIVWTLSKAIELLQTLPEQHKKRICRKIGYQSTELERWKAITKRMNIIIKKGIICQFDGYFDLKEIDFKAYKEKYGKVERMDRVLKSEGKSPNEYKVAKQADVLMLFYLFPLAEIREIFRRLGYTINKKALQKNYDYYIKRTSHGSTLSKVVHCFLAQQLGRSKEAWGWFQEVLKSDVNDTQGGTTLEGIHCGVMGGSINIVMKGFAGVDIYKNYVRINPKLPKKIKSIQLRFRYKRSRISLSVTKKHIAVYVHGFRPSRVTVPIEIAGKLHHVPFGKTHNVSYTQHNVG